MKVLVYFYLLTGLVLSAIAQPSPQTVWSRLLNFSSSDYATAVCPVPGGGFAVAGCVNYSTNPITSGGMLIRLNSNGDTLWTRLFPGSPAIIYNAISPTGDGGFILAGFRSAPDDSAGSALLVKTDSAGFMQWMHIYGRSLEDAFSDVLVMPDGGFVCTGYSVSETQLRTEVLLVRTTSTGDSVWTRIFPIASGGTGAGLCTTTDGGFVIVGTASSNGSDILAIKTNSQGDLDWIQTYDGRESEWGASVQATSDGGYLLSGSRQINNDRVDLWLIKTDRSGDTLWTTYPVVSAMSTGAKIIPTARHGFIVTGTYFPNSGYGDMLLMRVDSLGHSVWMRHYLVNQALENGIGLCPTENGGYVLTGCQYIGDGSQSQMLILRSGADILLPAEDEHSPVVPEDYTLDAYPNPFNPSTSLVFSLPVAGQVTLIVYDLLGREARILTRSELFAAGEQHFTWNAAALPSGVYIARLSCGDVHLTKKLLLLK